jgi:hypothetical protein
MLRGKSLLLAIRSSMLQGIPLNYFSLPSIRKNPSIMKRLVLCLLIFGFVQNAFADDPTPPVTKLVKPGKLIWMIL